MLVNENRLNLADQRARQYCSRARWRLFLRRGAGAAGDGYAAALGLTIFH